GLLALGAGWLVHRTMSASDAPSLVVGFIKPKMDDPEAKKMAKDLEEELDLAGSSLRGARWLSRQGVLEQLYKAGITDMEQFERVERGACLISKNLGLKFPITGRLERLPGGKWQLVTRITDVQELIIVGKFTAEGATVHELIDPTVQKLQQWVDLQ